MQECSQQYLIANYIVLLLNVYFMKNLEYFPLYFYLYLFFFFVFFILIFFFFFPFFFHLILSLLYQRRHRHSIVQSYKRSSLLLNELLRTTAHSLDCRSHSPTSYSRLLEKSNVCILSSFSSLKNKKKTTKNLMIPIKREFLVNSNKECSRYGLLTISHQKEAIR